VSATVAASTTPAADRRAFYPCFDGLRAIAAIAVVMHHASIATAFSFRQVGIPLTDVRWPIGKYFVHMDAGVTIFFLISGFLLYRPFVASAFDERSPMGPRRFFRHRFLRIFPAYWVAFICITLFVGLSMPIGGRRSIIEYFLLLHLYDPQHGGARALGGISQSWTLVVEISFYLFLPLYAYVMRRIGGRREMRERFRVELLGLLTLVAISVLWRAFVYWGVPKTSALHELGQYWLIAQLDLFALGMGLAVIRTWLDRRDEPVAFFDMIGRHDLLWWFLALVPFQIVSMHIGLAATLKPVTGGQAYLRQFLYGATALFLLLPAVFGKQERGATRRFLQLAPMVYLGTISYGIYLWHQAFLTKVHQWWHWERRPGENILAGFRGNFLISVGVALALSIAVATLSWFLIEKPLLRRKDKPLFGDHHRQEIGVG
jgi:peptidoglycan/LPS O-acetylase OafA/YrhL